MRKPLLFFLFFIMICSSASAWGDNVEEYATDYTEKYTILAETRIGEYGSTQSVWAIPVIAATTDTRAGASRNTVLSVGVHQEQYINKNTCWHFIYLVPLKNSSSPYFSYIITGYSQPSTQYRTLQKLRIYNADKTVKLAEFDGIYMDTLNTSDIKVEIIKSGTEYQRYINGILVDSATSSSPAYTGDVKYCPGIAQDCNVANGVSVSYIYFDDLTDSSIVGVKQLFDESTDNITVTWSSQLMRSYPDQQTLTIYSLSNTNNSGEISSYDIPQDDNSTTSEHGYLDIQRDPIFSLNSGLYMLEMTRGSVVLAYQYFYYDQLSNPQGFPEVLFLAETNTAAEIRDEDNNGGIISGGSSVYLYPDEKEDGYYNFTIDFSEPSYSRRVELTKIYNTPTLNGSIFSYSGLTENYNVSRDSTLIDHTNGSDSWDNTVTWIGQDSYIYEFDPDLSLPGFWGYVKNSETQTAIKSATVSITNGTDTFYVYTDENGMYYLTNGIANGSTYTVQAKKTNYESSNPYNLTTTAGATTRQDLYLSKASGSGVYYAPHDVGFTVLEYWYSGAGLPGVSYTISSEDDGELKTGTTDSKGMFTGSDMTGGTNYTITLTYDGKTYTEHVEPSLTEYTFVLNKEGVLHQYANSWLTLSYTENTNNVTIAYESNKTITGASLTAIANNGTTVYSQTLTTRTGSFTFETGGEGDYTLNFHIQATDGDTASQSWGLSYPSKVPLFPDSYPAWLKNVLFSGIVIVFLLSFGKAKNDIACGSVAILTSMGYLFEWFTCSFYFVVLVWIIALGAAFIHYKRTGGIG